MNRSVIVCTDFGDFRVGLDPGLDSKFVSLVRVGKASVRMKSRFRKCHSSTSVFWQRGCDAVRRCEARAVHRRSAGHHLRHTKLISPRGAYAMRRTEREAEKERGREGGDKSAIDVFGSSHRMIGSLGRFSIHPPSFCPFSS